MEIIKRNGNLTTFDKDKISIAINKAYLDVKGKINNTVADRIAAEIEELIEDKKTTVEDIQNMVENCLMDEDKEVARSYIRYRYKKEVARHHKDDFMKAISEKLQASNVQNQNANVDEKSFGGRVGEVNRLIMKDYALKYCMSDMARENHINNMIYEHDLDSYAVGMHNCLTIPFDKLLANGFNTRQADVRPANSVNTAFQLVAVIFQLQSLQQFGGVSASHLDWTMVPYVRKSFFKHFKDGLRYADGHGPLMVEKVLEEVNETTPIDEYPTYLQRANSYRYAMEMTERETAQAAEGMYHNLNTLQSRSGNQLPFTSINYGTCTLPEGRMVTKALLEASIKGVGKLHKTSIFPCGIFQVMKGVNKEPGTPNYDLKRLALKSTAQRLYPNYANVDWSGNAGYDVNDPSTYFSTINKTVA